MYVTTLDLEKLVTSWQKMLFDKQIINRNYQWQSDTKSSWISLTLIPVSAAGFFQKEQKFDLLNILQKSGGVVITHC